MVTQHTQMTTTEQLKGKPNNMVCTNYKFAVVLDRQKNKKEDSSLDLFYYDNITFYRTYNKINVPAYKLCIIVYTYCFYSQV